MPRHDTFGDPAAAGVVERPEPQRVHDGDRPGAHGEDVAQDAADAGGRALVGLDGGRVVVALDADGGGDAVADVDDAGALARADEHALALGGQPLEVDARRLVGAVLGPHHRVHGQLEVVRLPPEDATDVVELVVGEAEGPVERRSAAVVTGRGYRPAHLVRDADGATGRTRTVQSRRNDAA